MATSSDISVLLPKQTVTELTNLTQNTATKAKTKPQTVSNVLGKAIRLLKLATMSDEISVTKGGKTYTVNLENL